MESAAWNDKSDVLVAIADARLVTWYYPNAVFVDKDLLGLASTSRDAAEFGKVRPIISSNDTVLMAIPPPLSNVMPVPHGESIVICLSLHTSCTVSTYHILLGGQTDGQTSRWCPAERGRGTVPSFAIRLRKQPALGGRRPPLQVALETIRSPNHFNGND